MGSRRNFVKGPLTSLKIYPHNYKEKKGPPHGENAWLLKRKNALHMEKKASIRVESLRQGIFFFDFSGWSRQAPTLAPPRIICWLDLLAHMNESNYKMHKFLENYSSHNYIKIHARM